MALLDFLGFDHFPSSISLTQYPKWVLSGGFSKVAGQVSGSAAQAAGSGYLVYSDATPRQTWIMGCRFKTGNAMTGSGGSILLALCDASASPTSAGQYGIWINNSGKLEARAGYGGAIQGTSSITLVNSSWYYIEAKIKIHSSTGSVEVRVGGSTEINVSGINTQNSANATATYCNFFATSSQGAALIFDDVYVSDTTGSAPHNDFLGQCIVDTMFPTSNNAVTWTPLSSTNVSQIQETALDDDTTYNSTTTSGNVDTFNHGAMPVTPTSIFGVSVIHRARKDDVAARSSRNKLISGATTANGTSTGLSTSYQHVKDVWPTDPNGSIAWTKTNVDATKIGYEHV